VQSTILYKLWVKEVVCTVPTVGANHESFTYKNVAFEARPSPALAVAPLTPVQMWDLGGQAALRSSWPVYFKGTDAIICVVDSTDRSRLGFVKSEVDRLLACEDLARACILVYANKQDLRDAMDAEELTQALGLQAVRTHAYHVQASCALTGEGLYDGLSWLTAQVTHTPVDITAEPGKA
jgi:ADP-ribosylation factor-like protein 5B